MGFRQQLELVLYRTYADLKAEAERSYLGFLWWIIEPLFYLLAFYILFVFVLERGGSDFVPFFLSGVVVWKWFDSAVKAASQSISAHAGIIQQIYVPKHLFVFGAIIGSSVRFIPVFFLLLVFLYFQGVLVLESIYYLVPVLLIQFFFIVACAMIAGAIVPFFPDLKIVLDNVFLAMFFLSGIFFDINEVKEPVSTYLMWNPMVVIIDAYRAVLLRGNMPHFGDFVWIGSVSLIAIMGAFYAYRLLDLKFSKVRF